MDTFPDRLIAAIDRKEYPTAVGIDPQLDLMPPALVKRYFDQYGQTHTAGALAVRDFTLRLLDAITPHVPAVKLQAAFFEALGPPGMQVFADMLLEARQRGLVVIADVKRGDIDSTAQAYATAYLGNTVQDGNLAAGFEADAVTVNAYLGMDGILPFLEAAKAHNKGLFIVLRTSNPSAGDLQDLSIDGTPLYERLAALVQRWGEGTEGRTPYHIVGAVVGATYPAEAARLRGLMPRTFFLVPGYGAQGAGAEDVRACFNPDGYGALVSSSRAIIYAYRREPYRALGEENFAQAATAAARAMQQELAAVLRPS